jgi:hypothetical protein
MSKYNNPNRRGSVLSQTLISSAIATISDAGTTLAGYTFVQFLGNTKRYRIQNLLSFENKFSHEELAYSPRLN